MAGRIGFTPTATSVEVREPDGDVGIIPAATSRSAGVMTARHAQALEMIERQLAIPGGIAAPANNDAPALPPPRREATSGELHAVSTALARIEAVEASFHELRRDAAAPVAAIEEIARRVAAIEQRPAAPLPQGLVGVEVDPVSVSRIGALEHRVTDTEDRMAAVERNLMHPPDPSTAPVSGDDDSPLPGVFQRWSLGSTDTAPAVQITPAHEIAMGDALGRLDELEQAISRLGADVRSIPRQQPDLGPIRERLAKLEAPPPAPALPPPMERIAAAVRRKAEQAPPVRVVEAAHLARNGQERPIKLMQEIAEAQGCGWEDSARDIIRAHDRATEIAARAYAVECDARRRITAGESAEGVAKAALAALDAIGG